MLWRFKAIASAILTGILYVLGGLDVSLKTLLIVIVMDILTGLLKAAYNGELDSETGLKGIIKKVALLVLVAVAHSIDTVAGNTGMIRTLVIYYLVSNEGLSILENLGALGVPIPEFLKDKLSQLKEGNDNGVQGN